MSPSRISLLVCLLVSLVLQAGSLAATYRVVAESPIDDVPSWFPVNFCLFTHGGKHFVAYYDAGHGTTIAACPIGSDEWHKIKLPSRVGWDSHNYLALAADANGDIHLSGNMHNVPLVYFRTQQSGEIESIARARMVGRNERNCTYPVFLTDAEKNLMFMYRDGGSGNGSSIVNRYDAARKTWTRFLDEPLFDGEGERNSYPLGPLTGPDGRFHLVWVWRDTPDCATNHHLSYARSDDLKHWETASGEPLDLPLRLGQEEAWIDPVPSGGGIINGCQKLAFDQETRPIVSYHKSDEAGNMQIYVSRFVDGQWRTQPITKWDKPIEFSGFGSMPFIGIQISGPRRLGTDHFVLDYRHRDYGKGSIVFDEHTLAPTTEHPPIETPYPEELMQPTSDWPGILVRTAEDVSAVDGATRKYLLRWETLETNQDAPRDPPLPPPSQLKLITLERD
jgi:hypothetical protein